MIITSVFQWIAIAVAAVALIAYVRYAVKLNRTITKLRAFAAKAERGEDLSEVDFKFPEGDLGDVSKNIVQLYAQLQNSEDDKTRLKRQLTQNIAHELKTPVSSIRGYLETIVTDKEMAPEVREQFIERCYEQSDRLSNLLQDISLLIRMDEASKDFEVSEVDIYNLVTSIKNEVAQQLEEKHMKMLVLIPPDLIVNGNQPLLYSVFRNLTDNAIAYAGEGTVITVRYRDEEDGRYFFSFSDNGEGVAEEHLPHIFERFYRVDTGRSRKLGGTGLGLSIVKNAVLLHGGAIKAKIATTGGLEYKFTLKK